MSVQGRCDDRFGELARLLDASLDAGDDLGASIAVTLEDETVVDVWGGWADADKTIPWTADTIVNCWSNTKTVLALAALVLADRGELDLFAPVARYWPEFAANGKDGIEVRHLLAHTSGLAGWDPPVELSDILDPDKSVAMLAAQAPWWEPGTASGYHGMTYGHLVGEVIRRVTGAPVSRFVAEEIAGPLTADFLLGFAAEHDHRVSDVIPPPPLDVPMELVDTARIGHKFPTGPPITADAANTSDWRRSQVLGAVNGHGNARSLARIQSVVSHEGEFDGVRLLSPETCDLIFHEQSNGVDLMLGFPLRFGIGYSLPHPQTVPFLPHGRVCFWAGWGGSITINDLDHHMTFSYIMNKMEGGALGETRGLIGGLRAEPLIRATYAALK